MYAENIHTKNPPKKTEQKHQNTTLKKNDIVATNISSDQQQITKRYNVTNNVNKSVRNQQKKIIKIVNNIKA